MGDPNAQVSDLLNPNRVPNRPGFESDYITDPSDPRIKGFDTSGMKEALLRDISQQQQQAQAQTLANSSMALGSGSRSTGTQGQLSSLAAQAGYAKNKALSDLAMKEWQDRQGIGEAMNRAIESRNKLKMGAFEDEMGAYNSKQQAQAQNNAAMAQLAAMFAGGI